MVFIQELLIYICIRVSRDTYNRRGMSNMQLNDGPHSAWAGACRTSSALPVPVVHFSAMYMYFNGRL